MAAKGGGGGVGTLKSTSINGVKLYSVTGKNYVAPWVLAKKKRSLRKDAEYQRRLELIHDLRFETATTRIKVTPDGQYVIASGIYPPQMKVFELKELSMKFERHMISEIVDFEVLGDDYSKLAFLCADRSVCLHAKYGSHYSVRIPRMGRDLAYDCWSCDLLCAASSPDLYRINLEQGRFLASLSTQSPAINVVTRSMIHGLVACGGEDGAVECFDMRRKSSVGRIDTTSSSEDIDQEVTSLQFDENQGYLIAVGSSIGKVSVYDIRMSSPLRVKDHMYGSPILNIKWHQSLNSTEPKLITADKHIVRVWDPNTGNNMTSIEPDNGSINDVCIFPNSGLMLLALDNSQIPAHFIPALGPAPKWCSHLDNLTEEMEEKQENTLYDDYKFLTEEEMERLGLSEYKNSDAVRAHLHGYVIRYDLYKKQRAKLDIMDYETLQKEMKKKKLDAQRKSRITVNRQMFDNILAEEEEMDADVDNVDKSSTRKKKRRLELTKSLLTDPRFDEMFKNKAYEVDVTSSEYQALHPQVATVEPPLIEEHFDSVSEDEDEQDAGSSDESDSDNDMHNSKRIRLYEVKDDRHAEAFLNSVSLGGEEARPLGDRVAALERQQNSRALDKVKYGPGGSREISFIARSSRRRNDEEDEHSEEEATTEGAAEVVAAEEATVVEEVEAVVAEEAEAEVAAEASLEAEVQANSEAEAEGEAEAGNTFRRPNPAQNPFASKPFSPVPIPSPDHSPPPPPPVVAAAAMLSLSRALGRRLFSSAAAAAEGGAVASTSVVRKAQNPLEEFFEVERSAADDQARPHYGSSDGSFGNKGSKFGAILIGQAAVFIGLSSNALLAQDDSVAPADSSEQADANAAGLRRIEDGSVISNEHTIKWRMCTDNARDYFLKGKLAEAEKLFKAALQEAKEGFGLRDPHVASALNNLAEFYRLRKEYEKAEPLYMEAVEILEQSFGPDDIRVGTALRNLGQYYHIQRRFDQAQTCYERALKVMNVNSLASFFFACLTFVI
ncbi:hypothetical protein ACQ4PT_056776 [Festuca glaucescens]